jgi:arginine exporter protein ArgO
MEFFDAEQYKFVGIILMMVGFLGINYLIVKEKTVRRNIKIGMCVFTILFCSLGVSYLKMNEDKYYYGYNSEYFKKNAHLYHINY